MFPNNRPACNIVVDEEYVILLYAPNMQLTSHVSGLAGTTSMWLPRKVTVLSPVPVDR